jgi:hypothetical protein
VLLAGVQYTRIAVDSPPATINPNIVGYVGGYYEWDNNWKLTGRLGVQSFGGAQLPNLTPFQLSRSRWVPKPSCQLTI